MRCTGAIEWLCKDGLPAKRRLEELVAEHVNGASNNSPGVVTCLQCKDTASASSLHQSA